ncbi:MAG TPA: VPDSG-CTERM sorting domain-containing protein [Verrucomicrobiae bacterium]|nr:VPDSG-CTERM sorting domain-containing protein [Verrucomicrobiae bacterium]
MKTKLTIIAAVAAAAMALQSTQATPITGVIGFSGTASLDSSVASSATEVTGWGNNFIGLHTGSFASLTGTASVAFNSPWTFASSGLPSFWTITDSTGNYTFNLTSSKVFSTGSTTGPLGTTTSISILIFGTVVSTVAGLDATAFTGSMTIQDPSVDNGTNPKTFSYTESLSFSPVPDGGTTVLLLGSALSGLALLRRKLSA